MFLETILADATQTDDDPRTKPSAIAGQWRSRLGSTMTLTVTDDHRIEGTFHTAVGTIDPTQAFHVVGYAEGDALAFCVDFGSRGSVAAWSGHHIADDDGDRLVTLWHLGRPVRQPHQEADVWGSILAGSDEFRRID